MKEIDFIKMSGGGNDFILIDNRRDIIRKNRSGIARKLCQRKISVGADGLILIEKARSQHFRMRIFNPDGSEPEMCGNGSRCAAFFAYTKKIAPSRMRIQTKAGEIQAQVKNKSVKVNLTPPKNMKLDYILDVDEKKISVNSINTGVPHVVIYTADLGKMDVKGMGGKIRFHSLYAPEGTNVDFIKITSPHSISIRTYERGVESETLACGTGATAASIIAGMKGLVSSPVKVKTAGGEELKIYFSKNDALKVSNVFLEGKVEVVYRGKIRI